MDKTYSLGDRMKNYENVPKLSLMKRTPVIIRLDGKAFHSFCRGFNKPFDKILVKTMQLTMEYLCKNIQGCVLGYTQSDEITLFLKDWQSYQTQAWFDNEIQKMASISASMATMSFNKNFNVSVKQYIEIKNEICKANTGNTEKAEKEASKYFDKIGIAMFDSRVFNLPKEEVCNNFIWRQQDATRNSILSLAQSIFSPKQIYGLSCNELQDKMFLERNINWNDLPTTLKRGSCCIKTDSGWIIDDEIPIFTQDRNYIEQLL